MNITISDILRVDLTPEGVAEIEAGWDLQGSATQHIPCNIIPYRQVRLSVEAPQIIDCNLKMHRGDYIPVISRATSNKLIADGHAEAEEQSWLVQSRLEYLADPEMSSPECAGEKERVEGLPGDTLIVVAMIGNSRSPLSFTRNVVNKVTTDEFVEEAEKALTSANVFLVEG